MPVGYPLVSALTDSRLDADILLIYPLLHRSDIDVLRMTRETADLVRVALGQSCAVPLTALPHALTPLSRSFLRRILTRPRPSAMLARPSRSAGFPVRVGLDPFVFAMHRILG